MMFSLLLQILSVVADVGTYLIYNSSHPTNGSVICDHSTGCEMHCNGDYSCNDTTINAQSASYLTLTASGNSALKSTVIWCPDNGECAITATGRESGIHMKVYCGTNGTCDITGRGVWSLWDAQLRAETSTKLTVTADGSFESIVSFIDCPRSQPQPSCIVRVRSDSSPYFTYGPIMSWTNFYVDSINDVEFQCDAVTDWAALFIDNDVYDSAYLNAIYYYSNWSQPQCTFKLAPSYSSSNFFNTHSFICWNGTNITIMNNKRCVPWDPPAPTLSPTSIPTNNPTNQPTQSPTSIPTISTSSPSKSPSEIPTMSPSKVPTKLPTMSPTQSPTKTPTQSPTKTPTQKTIYPTKQPTQVPSISPTQTTKSPSKPPTAHPLMQLMVFVTDPPTQTTRELEQTVGSTVMNNIKNSKADHSNQRYSLALSDLLNIYVFSILLVIVLISFCSAVFCTYKYCVMKRRRQHKFIVDVPMNNLNAHHVDSDSMVMVEALEIQRVTAEVHLEAISNAGNQENIQHKDECEHSGVMGAITMDPFRHEDDAIIQDNEFIVRSDSYQSYGDNLITKRHGNTDDDMFGNVRKMTNQLGEGCGDVVNVNSGSNPLDIVDAKLMTQNKSEQEYNQHTTL